MGYIRSYRELRKLPRLSTSNLSDPIPSTVAHVQNAGKTCLNNALRPKTGKCLLL